MRTSSTLTNARALAQVELDTIIIVVPTLDVLVLTLLSGLYVIVNRYPPAYAIISFGFPYAWLETGVVYGALPPVPAIPYVFYPSWFVDDLLIYGGILCAAVYGCFRLYKVRR